MSKDKPMSEYKWEDDPMFVHVKEQGLLEAEKRELDNPIVRVLGRAMNRGLLAVLASLTNRLIILLILHLVAMWFMLDHFLGH